MLALVISTQGKGAAFCEIEDSLQAYYEAIGCDLIDITTRKINGANYEIVCDDEGLFKEAPIVSAVNRKGKPELVGGLVIAKYDGDGGLKGLDPDDVLRLTNAIQYTIQHDKLQPVVMLD